MWPGGSGNCPCLLPTPPPTNTHTHLLWAWRDISKEGPLTLVKFSETSSAPHSELDLILIYFKDSPTEKSILGCADFAVKMYVQIYGSVNAADKKLLLL